MTVREALSNMSIFLGSQGLKPDSKMALFYLNRARRLVYPLEDWVHTIKYGCVKLNDCCFVLPEDMTAIRAAWECDTPLQINNEYFDSINRDQLKRARGRCVNIFRAGRQLAIPYKETGEQIYFQAINSDDAGSNVSINYISCNGNLLTDNLQLPDDFQLIGTEEEVKETRSITKERTMGQVDIVDHSGKVLYTMAPDQTSLRFEEYKVSGKLCCKNILVKCKIRFRDYTKDDLDKLIDIESIDALEFAAMALYEKSQSNIQGYQQNILIARTHLEVAKEDLETSMNGYEVMKESYPINVTQHDSYSDYKGCGC